MQIEGYGSWSSVQSSFMTEQGSRKERIIYRLYEAGTRVTLFITPSSI